MNKHILLILSTLGLSACISTSPNITYYKDNFESMKAYNEKNREELDLLTTKINEECVLSKMRDNLTIEELVSIPLNGTVIFDITVDGTISSIDYLTKDIGSVKRRKLKCIKKVALGYKIPPSKNVEKVFSKFNINIDL